MSYYTVLDADAFPVSSSIEIPGWWQGVNPWGSMWSWYAWWTRTDGSNSAGDVMHPHDGAVFASTTGDVYLPTQASDVDGVFKARYMPTVGGGPAGIDASSLIMMLRTWTPFESGGAPAGEPQKGIEVRFSGASLSVRVSGPDGSRDALTVDASIFTTALDALMGRNRFDGNEPARPLADYLADLSVHLNGDLMDVVIEAPWLHRPLVWRNVDVSGSWQHQRHGWSFNGSSSRMHGFVKKWTHATWAPYVDETPAQGDVDTNLSSYASQLPRVRGEWWSKTPTTVAPSSSAGFTAGAGYAWRDYGIKQTTHILNGRFGAATTAAPTIYTSRNLGAGSTLASDMWATWTQPATSGLSVRLNANGWVTVQCYGASGEGVGPILGVSLPGIGDPAPGQAFEIQLRRYTQGAQEYADVTVDAEWGRFTHTGIELPAATYLSTWHGFGWSGSTGMDEGNVLTRYRVKGELVIFPWPKRLKQHPRDHCAGRYPREHCATVYRAGGSW